MRSNELLGTPVIEYADVSACKFSAEVWCDGVFPSEVSESMKSELQCIAYSIFSADVSAVREKVLN